MSYKVIACDLGSNIFFEDWLLSIKLFLNPFADKKNNNKLEDLFTQKFQKNSWAVSFNSGRSALLTILRALNLKQDDEVLFQAYTCVAIPDCILWSNLKPIYIDIDTKTFNMDDQDLQQKITKKAKVLIIQHTFGIPANLDKLLAIAKQHKLVVIEDCAHALGVKYQDQYLGTFGDVGLYSFGRDKMISSVFGGMAVTSNRKLGQKISELQKMLAYPTIKWTLYQLAYNIIIFIISRTYNLLNFGKALHLIAKKTHLLSKSVLNIEKKAQKPYYFPQKMSPALSQLAISQLKRLDGFNEIRLDHVNTYNQGLSNMQLNLPKFTTPLLRYPLVLKDRNKLQIFAKDYGIYLGDWYDSVIGPKTTDLTAINYKNDCPRAEKVAELMLNLPTSPTLSKEDILRVVSALNKYNAKS